MDTARWMRVRSIVERAVELQGAERDAFLAGECGGDAELLNEVASLLELDSTSAALRLPDPLEVARAIGDANLGRRIGPYVIERLLGAGGMGVVYLARRVDSDFEQHVALKLIKRGMDTDDILRQFRKERAVLAALQHPCIARLYDGGATDDGRPWIAMEHVEGVPIDVWCAERRLSVRARVELFIEVCSAVQHAHQALIVHRDLKPSNILVTSEGTPKLLDFGVAKVLTPEGAEATEPTIASARHLTPAYASPQQLHGEAATTATDVYSLGVVLYELLAGSHPFRGESGERAEPAKPSTRATRADEPQAASAGDLRRIRRQIRGDLDTIVLTALAPELGRRYASVEALSGDLRRYLEGLPIQARPATWAYQTSKFVRRHAVAVAAGAAVVTALVVGLLFARAGYVEAVAQRKLAEQRESTAKTESARSDAMVALTQRMLRAASPHDVKDRDYTVRQLLDDFDRSVGGNWGVEPQVEATMREIMGRVYRELGILDKAETHLARALELDRDALGEDDERTIECRMSWITLLHDRGEYAVAEADCSSMLARLEPRADRRAYLAAVLTERGDQLQHLNRLDESESDLRRALDIRREPRLADQRLIAETLAALSSTLQARRDFGGAEQTLDEALEIMRREYGERSIEVASALNNLGVLLQLGGHPDRAEAPLRDSLDIEREVLGTTHTGTGVTLNNLGRLLLARGDSAGAEPLLREALALARSGHGDGHPSVATDLSTLALLLQQRGDYAGAEPLFRECLQIRLAAYGELHVDTTRAMNNLALLLQKRGNLEEAEVLLRRALATRRKMQGERDLTIAAPLINLSGVLLAKNDLAAAEQAAREAVSIFRENVGPAHVDLASGLDILGGVRISQGANEEAEALIREALEMRIGLFGREHPDVARSLAHLGDVLASNGDLAGAESKFAEAEAMQRRLIGARNPTLARTLHNRANVAELSGRPADAEAGFREALSIRRSTLGDAHADTRETARRLIALLEVRGESEGAADLRRELGLDVAGATAEH